MECTGTVLRYRFIGGKRKMVEKATLKVCSVDTKYSA